MSEIVREENIYGFMPSVPACIYNSGVLCDEQDIPKKCMTCGWNPEEAMRRKIAFRAEYIKKIEAERAAKEAERKKEEEAKSGVKGDV